MIDISGKVCTFKMVSGEEIIGRVKVGQVLANGRLSSVIELDRPMVVRPVQTERGVDFQMYPWVFSVDGSIDLYEHTIMGTKYTDLEFEKAYLQRVSGLELPQTLIG